MLVQLCLLHFVIIQALKSQSTEVSCVLEAVVGLLLHNVSEQQGHFVSANLRKFYFDSEEMNIRVLDFIDNTLYV